MNTDLSRFDHIIPCGINDCDVTSMERLLESPVDLEMVFYSLTYHFGNEMGYRMVEAEALPESLDISRESLTDSHKDSRGADSIAAAR